MSLQQAMTWCDASCADELHRIYEHFRCIKHFEEKLVDGLRKPEADRAASWLLKHHLELGFILDAQLYRKVLLSLPHVKHWETSLHLLQILPLIEIDVELGHALFQYLKSLLSNDKKLVRAWAYNGLHEVAMQLPFYQTETARILHAVGESEVPSVQARIRKILKSGFYEPLRDLG